MKNSQQLIDLQNKVVLCVANSIRVKWDHLLVNYEREVIDDEPSQDCLFVAFVWENNNWKRQSLQLPIQCYDLFLDLCSAMSNDGESQWGSCTVEVDSSGKYRFAFSYDLPKRLNGDFSDEALLKHYIPQPL